MFYYDWTYLLLIPGLLLGFWAQAKVKGAYAKYSRIATRLGRPASDVVMELLRRNGNMAVGLARVNGEMTDHYNPQTETLSLSEGVYDSSSIAALGIAAHEAGHAMQKQQGYAPMAIRGAIVPVVNIGSGLSTPLFIAGLIFAYKPLVTIGIVLFALTTFFTLVTLPVEFDASRRALRMLTEGGYVTGDEEKGVKAVLSAAAMTYVAAAVTSLLGLLRLMMISRSRD